jgi:hypothetical protein
MPAHPPTLLDILAHTPLWVWALYAFVLFMGWQRSRERIVSVWRLLVLPGLLLILTVSGWIGAGLESLPAILLGFVAGGTGGWLLVREGAARRLEGNKLWLRGDIWTFVQIVFILVFRYATTVAGILNPAFATDPVWHPLTLLISSALTGLFLGRLAGRLKVFFTTSPAAA